MERVTWTSRPDLDHPVLIAAFRGWNDGGEAASTAAAYLRDRWGAEPLADIDPDGFLDFQMTRPTVRLEAGVTRRIDWPELRFSFARVEGRDVVVFLGIEPNVRWRAFVETFVGAARAIDVGEVVTLGAFLADVPHTRPTPVTGLAVDPGRSRELGLTSSRYEGPTGIVGVVHDAMARGGFGASSLWAAVPHYLPGGPNPKAAVALVQKIGALTGLTANTDTLDRAAGSWEAQVTSTIADNAELSAYVRRLEQVAGEREGPSEIPSGEALADELERFLREQRGDGG
ncbi:MAG TPA: PAC2 family protein [Actinomycetota bacterium]|nr:PAC2 family protein [Actinomycetota bacterium]